MGIKKYNLTLFAWGNLHNCSKCSNFASDLETDAWCVHLG